jgi:hypothetical protein
MVRRRREEARGMNDVLLSPADGHSPRLCCAAARRRSGAGARCSAVQRGVRAWWRTSAARVQAGSAPGRRARGSDGAGLVRRFCERGARGVRTPLRLYLPGAPSQRSACVGPAPRRVRPSWMLIFPQLVRGGGGPPRDEK